MPGVASLLCVWIDLSAAIMKPFLVIDAASAVVVVAVVLLGPNARQSSAFVPVRTTHVPKTCHVSSV